MTTTMMAIIRQYGTYWLTVAKNSLQETFVNRATNALFITGKIVRLLFSLLFLLAIQENLQVFGQYSTDQLLLFFTTYQIIDVSSQAVFRGVYTFTYQIRRGDFDFVLTKPIKPLFQALFGTPDINDVVFLVPLAAVVVFLVSKSAVTITPSTLLPYLLLLANGFLIAAALHIGILAFGILTMDVDGITWLYRDFLYLGQLPVDVYRQPIRGILSYGVPIGIMISVPARYLLGFSALPTLIFALIAGVIFLLLSIILWNRALKTYASASS